MREVKKVNKNMKTSFMYDTLTVTYQQDFINGNLPIFIQMNCVFCSSLSGVMLY